MKKITETELFDEIKILLLNENKVRLEKLKINCSKITNMSIDNSSFVRAVIEYFFANEEKLVELSDFLRNAKGFSILKSLEDMLAENASAEEIRSKLGINISIIKKIQKKINK